MRIVLTLVSFLSASDAQAVEFSAYSDQAGLVLRLSEEKQEPFLFLGRSISDSDVHDKYGSSVLKFPSVRECLQESEAKTDFPNLTTIDWAKLKSTEDADVFLFRIASSYSKIDDFKSWLEFFHFRASARIQRQNAKPMGIWIGLSASRIHKGNGGPLFYKNRLQIIFGAGHSISLLAQYSEQHEIISMRTVFNTK